LRTVLIIRLLFTFLRKRLSKLSCDSPGLSFTVTFADSLLSIKNFVLPQVTLIQRDWSKSLH
jgi:hypothetical protein